MNVDLNQNIAKCVQTAAHFGYTEYVNICNGAHQIVHWGGGDWLGLFVLSALGLGVLALLGSSAVMIVKS